MLSDELFKQACQYLQAEDYLEAIELYQNCLTNEPEEINYYWWLGLAYLLADEKEEAQGLWMSVLLGQSLEDMEQNTEQLTQFLKNQISENLQGQKVIEAYKIYEVLQELDESDEDESIRLLLNHQLETYQSNAREFFEKGQYKEAETCYRKLLYFFSNESEYWYQLSIIYYYLQDLQNAFQSIIKSIEIDETQSKYHSHLGLIAHQSKNHDLAINAYQATIDLDPKNADVYYNLVELLQTKGRMKEALSLSDQAVQMFPDDYLIKYQNALLLPIIYQDNQEIDQFREHFHQSLRVMLEQLPTLSDRQVNDAFLGIQTIANFLLAYQGRNDYLLQKDYGTFVHKIMSQKYPQWLQAIPKYSKAKGEKIKIGYLSHYLRNHTVGRLFIGWLQYANHEQFETYCYYTAPQRENLTDEFENYSDCFYYLNGLSFEEICQQIIKDKIDILVYLDIGMEAFITPLAALRLAPIQCVSWGHPVTTGLPTIDYFLSNEIMEPPNGQEQYSEQLIPIANLGTPYHSSQLSTLEKSRSDFNLSDNDVLYLSCQSLWKYLPQYDYIFAEIAQQVPQAKFLFAASSIGPEITQQFYQRLQQTFAEYGLNSHDYCVILPRLNYEDFLSINCLSDAFLDSFQWSGGMTSLDAVACHLPLVTLPGDLMRGRQSYGMLNLIEVTDTIAQTEEQYIQIAVKLGLDSQWRQEIKEKMQKNAHRLFDDLSCISELEDFYQTVVFG